MPHDDSPIEKMCEVTGGRSYRVKSHYVLNQCIESLVQKVQPGVVVHFDQVMPKDLKDGEVQDIAFGSTKKMIYVQKHPTQKTFPVGFWPIPEPYWPDPKANQLPPRDAHPKLRIITPCVDEPPLVRNFPVDKYEVEASPLTLQILSKREPNKCWPVIVSNGLHGLEMPFGYLKASANFAQVHLMILPYNYLTLLPLLNDLFHKFVPNPPSDWVYKFSAYVRSVPQYYGPFLRRALVSANVPYQLLQYILPENLDSYLSPSVANYLKAMKNTAKQEQENMCLRVFKQLKMPKPPYHQVEMTKLNTGQLLKRDLVTHPQLKETFIKVHGEINIIDNYNIVVPTVFQQQSAKNYRNPFDVPRRDLIDEITRMRENFMRLPTSGINIYTKDAGHCLPISEMGNYQEYLKNKQSPLREIEPTNVRQHMFGNPYKKDKHMVMVDEADLNDVAPMRPPNPNTPMKKIESTNRARKRKAGPIRKDYIFRRMSTDSISSTTSSSSTLSSSNSLSSSHMSSIDSDDDMLSDTSSIRSSDEENDNALIIDFEFNDTNNDDDFNVNGHVQSFINGEIEDVDETITPSSLSIITTPSPLSTSTINNTTSINTANSSYPIISASSSTFGHSTSPLLSTSISALSLSSTSQQTIPPPAPSLLGLSSSSAAAAAAATVAAMALPAPATIAAAINCNGPIQPQNDYEAQEISKILQQCHNGMDQQRLLNDHKENDKKISEINENHHHNHHHQHHSHTNDSDYHNNHSNNNHHHHLHHLHNNHHHNQLHHGETITTTTTTNNKKHSNDSMAINNNSVNTTANNNNNTNHHHHNKKDASAVIDFDENDDEQKENVKQNNLQARGIIFKDIRRPGRDYSQLLDHLNLIKGSLEIRFTFVQMCISESLRFRRKKMADCIQEWWDKQIDKLNSSTSSLV